MTTVELGLRPVGYRMGWWVLVVITGLSVLNHVSALFAGLAETDEGMLGFWTLAALNVYALVIQVTVYRRGDPWAWWVTWVMIAVYGVTILYVPDVGRYYLGAAVVMAVAQLATWPTFQRSHRPRHVE